MTATCRSGCPDPGSHGSWGECARAANLQIEGRWDRVESSKAWDGELSAYADAKRQGIQPKTTKLKDIQTATKFADRTQVGNPWRH